MRIALGPLLLDRGNFERGGFHITFRRHGGAFIGEVEAVELLAVALDKAGGKSIAPGAVEADFDGPVFLGLEDFDLGFTFADQAQRDRLHPPGRTGPGELAPKNRRQFEAHQIVQGATRQIGFDELVMDVPGVVEGFLNGAFGDLVKHNALDVDVVEQAAFTQQLLDMPGNRLAFAIRVRGQIQCLGALERIHNGLDGFLGPGVYRPVHLEVFIRPDRAILGRQVADMPIGGEDGVVRTKILVDGLGLGRRFDDDDVHGNRVRFRFGAVTRTCGNGKDKV